MTLARSKVSISVARTLMRRTKPSSPLTTIWSPTRIGRSASRIRPETKFETIDLQAEADADRERAGDQRDLLRVDAELAERQRSIATMKPT